MTDTKKPKADASKRAEQSQAISTLVTQLSYLRNALDPDMTALAMAIFLEVSKHPGGVPMSRILDRFAISPSTGSRNVYLLGGGLVRRGSPRRGLGVVRTAPDPESRRSMNLFLSPRGAQVAAGLPK